MRVASFYRFARFDRSELAPLRERLLARAARAGVLGTVLLAEEGINGSLSGPEQEVERLLAWLARDPRLAELAIRRSSADQAPFFRLKVRLKREIVSLGVEGVDPLAGVGTYVPPSEWNRLIQDPRTLVVDTRNTYEVGLGSFAGAIQPGTDGFRQFPRWVEQTLPALMAERQPERLALFCTGGIRCEKATAYLLQRGFTGVHHLRGGILGYLEQVPPQQSLWRGECFVFDQRAALNERLEVGCHELCHGCRMPLAPADRQLPSYVPGVQCRHCQGRRDAADLARLAERQRQQQRAQASGEWHLGRRFALPPAP
ncbi:MAG: rhodanese-related sulfurtransferase [Cyanobacteriota bacterium]|nr:rhodanese-related sulfurtransferase [Cyanobacteriota bacterium]